MNPGPAGSSSNRPSLGAIILIKLNVGRMKYLAIIAIVLSSTSQAADFASSLAEAKAAFNTDYGWNYRMQLNSIFVNAIWACDPPESAAQQPRKNYTLVGYISQAGKLTDIQFDESIDFYSQCLTNNLSKSKWPRPPKGNWSAKGFPITHGFRRFQ